MSRERNSGIVLGLLAGAAIGSLMGVLFAPEKGSDTRKRVRRTAEGLKDDAIEEYELLAEKAKQGLNRLKEEYDKYRAQAKVKATEVVEDIENEIEKVKK